MSAIYYRMLTPEQLERRRKSRIGMKYSMSPEGSETLRRACRKLGKRSKGKKQTVTPAVLEGRRRMAQARIGTHYSLEARVRMSNAAKKRKPHSLETRAKISIALIQRLKKGKTHPGHRGKSGFFFSQKMNRKLHYRSTLELQWYQLLEQMPTVQDYYVERYVIPYNFKGVQHHYLPDLFIRYTDRTRELVEIKPEGPFFRNRVFRIKCHYAKLWCKKQRKPTSFRVVGYNELK